MYKIMLVEDDGVIANSLKSRLAEWGYEVYIVTEFKTVLESFLSYEPHLVLMDISLPYFNGYYWCTELRKRSKVPILFISSANEPMNIVMAINMGADDFIPKPFDLTVVIAKLQAILRRTYSFQGQINVIERNDVLLNLGDATLSYQGSKIHLTGNDFKILQILMENPATVVSREAIMVRLWESDSFIDDNTLTVNVTRLRKKLEEIGLGAMITTKKGIGYMVN